MKNFQNYPAEKYETADYEKIEEGIYKTKSPYETDSSEEVFVTSLSFEMEPDQYGEEDGSPSNISQVPFEDLLDEFCVYVTDFYDDLNEASEQTCYQEFGSSDLEDIKNLRTIIGKRVYAVPCMDDGEEYYDTKIE